MIARDISLGFMMLGIANSAVAATIDCKKAQTPVEKMICADTELTELDEHLNRYYSAGRATVDDAGACLQADQLQWLKAVRDPCKDTACLKTAYLTRLGELDALQPGATAIGSITLARVPALVWIVPPALDQVAAPPNPKAKPFEATGTLVDELATNPNADHGFVLRTKDGAVYPLVLLMFLDGKTPDHLSSLARERGATFRARGYAAGDKGKIYFEPSRCVFIYRMPGIGIQRDADKELEKVRLRVVTQGKVCPDPERPCEGFKNNELSFTIARPFKFDRGKDKSLPFYAVILKSAPLCGISEDERLRAQALFPRQKVFVHRYFCADFGDKATYSNVNEKVGFLAVYAGETEADAKTVLAQAKATGQFPDANIRRMEVIVVYQIE